MEVDESVFTDWEMCASISPHLTESTEVLMFTLCAKMALPPYLIAQYLWPSVAHVFQEAESMGWASREGFREGQPKILTWRIKPNPGPDVSQKRHGTSRRQVKLDEEVATEWRSCLQQAWEDAGILRAGGRVERMIGVLIFIPGEPEYSSPPLIRDFAFHGFSFNCGRKILNGKLQK